jgi:hypothetical protein
VLLEEHRTQVKQKLEELARHLQVIDLKIEHYKQLEATGENDRNCIFWKHYLEETLGKKLH